MGLSDKDKQALIDDVRFNRDAAIYQITLENLRDRRSDPIEVAIDDPLLAILLINPGSTEKATHLRSELAEPIKVGELAPFDSATLFILTRKSFDPPDAIKVMLDKQLVPLFVERYQNRGDTFGFVAMVMNYPNLSNFIIYMSCFILAIVLLTFIRRNVGISL